jgi:hypothetical protein
MAKITSISKNMVIVETNSKDVSEFVTLHRKSADFSLEYVNPTTGESTSGDGAFIALLTKSPGAYFARFGNVKLQTEIE